DMWLDEALTVNIARLPLSQLHGALRRDGAPPLYYVLLHFWMGAFGTSDGAVRALSGILSCATLPFVWVAGRCLGGRRVAASALVIVASSPFAVRYATENRMYALVIFLTAAGIVAIQRGVRRPTPWNLAALAVLAGLLLYSHYWSIYLVGVTFLWLVFQAWRGPESRRRGARACMVAVVVGCLTFLPWLPTFVFQSRHTGTPWATPANFAAMVNAITSFAGGATSQGRALALLYFALAGLGLFGLAKGLFHVDLDLRTRPPGRPFALITAGTLAAAIVGGYASASAFQARYASVVLVPLVLLVALGMSVFADRRIRTGVLAATVAFGLAGAVPNIWTSRTQAGQVAKALRAEARPGDIVAFCPDQIGPSVSRLVPEGRYRMITFPRGSSPEFVDWVDYAKATHAGNPGEFAGRLEQMRAPNHDVFLVWAPGYQTYGTKCEGLDIALSEDHALVPSEVFPYKQVNDSWITYEEMELVRFSPAAP
ncbi:MAG: glycosyltransferase family 39 protein, partial [Planctomycetes bacterium]|nr:glycosyltransferase family 39 protein [Planctomycetota bacterium]